MSQPVFANLQSLADLTGTTLNTELFEHPRPSDVECRGTRGVYRNQASIRAEYASKAQFLIGIAINDDARSPTDKDVLKETFAKANWPAENRSVRRCRPCLVSSRYAGLQ